MHTTCMRQASDKQAGRPCCPSCRPTHGAYDQANDNVQQPSAALAPPQQGTHQMVEPSTWVGGRGWAHHRQTRACAGVRTLPLQTHAWAGAPAAGGALLLLSPTSLSPLAAANETTTPLLAAPACAPIHPCPAARIIRCHQPHGTSHAAAQRFPPAAPAATLPSTHTNTNAHTHARTHHAAASLAQSAPLVRPSPSQQNGCGGSRFGHDNPKRMTSSVFLLLLLPPRPPSLPASSRGSRQPAGAEAAGGSSSSSSSSSRQQRAGRVCHMRNTHWTRTRADATPTPTPGPACPAPCRPPRRRPTAAS